jgi:hypothetical protein
MMVDSEESMISSSWQQTVANRVYDRNSLPAARALRRGRWQLIVRRRGHVGVELTLLQKLYQFYSYADTARPFVDGTKADYCGPADAASWPEGPRTFGSAPCCMGVKKSGGTQKRLIPVTMRLFGPIAQGASLKDSEKNTRQNKHRDC